MKMLAFLGVAFAVLVSGVMAQSTTPAASRGTDQEWLKQLVGAWDIKFKIHMQPEEPPATAVGTHSVRALGDHWIIAETETTMMNVPYNGVLSLGYDSQKKHFHGTWIDSFGGNLWVYKGTLNDNGDTLTLETEGPSPQDPGKSARYKEVIQITGKDSRTFTSSTKSQDGTWITIVTIEYRRKQ